MEENREAVFYSKIDAWLVAVMLLSLFAAVPVFYMMPIEHGAFAFVLILCLAVYLLGIHAVLSCKYIFRKDYLHIRSGVFVFVKIPYKDIKGFSDSRCLLSAPAASLDRIKINYGGKFFGIQKFTLVSPKDKNLFKELLAEKIAYARAAREV